MMRQVPVMLVCVLVASCGSYSPDREDMVATWETLRYDGLALPYRFAPVRTESGASCTQVVDSIVVQVGEAGRFVERFSFHFECDYGRRDDQHLDLAGNWSLRGDTLAFRYTTEGSADGEERYIVSGTTAVSLDNSLARRRRQ
jgi:hypothetical protein